MVQISVLFLVHLWVLSFLWQGVHAILAADPSVQESVLDLLLPHLELFVQNQGPPLKLEACASLQVPFLFVSLDRFQMSLEIMEMV